VRHCAARLAQLRDLTASTSRLSVASCSGGLSSIRQGQATDTWWRITDTWQEGESESDASLVPPDGLSQPVRGFGKAWRNNGFVREALGWANGPEQFYTSQWLIFEGGWMMVAPDGATVYALGADPGVSTGSHFGNFPR